MNAAEREAVAALIEAARPFAQYPSGEADLLRHALDKAQAKLIRAATAASTRREARTRFVSSGKGLTPVQILAEIEIRIAGEPVRCYVHPKINQRPRGNARVVTDARSGRVLTPFDPAGQDAEGASPGSAEWYARIAKACLSERMSRAHKSEADVRAMLDAAEPLQQPDTAN